MQTRSALVGQSGCGAALCFFQIGGVEALGEPTVDRREDGAGCGTTALLAAQSGKAHGGTQFPELCPLLCRDGKGFVIQFLGARRIPLP